MECRVVIDERLLDEARRATGRTDVDELIELGLRGLVRQQQLKALVDSFGTFDLDMTEEDLQRLRRADLDRLELSER